MSDEINSRRIQAAADYEHIADRLDLAARHLRRTGEHFRGGEVPRASAHVVPAFGLLSETGRGLAAKRTGIGQGASRANSLVRLVREHRMCLWLRKMIDVNNGVSARSTDHEHSHGIQRAAS